MYPWEKLSPEAKATRAASIGDLADREARIASEKLEAEIVARQALCELTDIVVSRAYPWEGA